MKLKRISTAIAAIGMLFGLGLTVNYGFAQAPDEGPGLHEGAGSADGFREGGPRGRSWIELGILNAIIQPNQNQQIERIMHAARGNQEKLRQNVHHAREALIAALLSGQNDVSKQVANLDRAESAILQEHVKLAQEIRAVLSPEQLRSAAQFWTKWHALQGQEHQEEQALIEQYSHGVPASH